MLQLIDMALIFAVGASAWCAAKRWKKDHNDDLYISPSKRAKMHVLLYNVGV
jgi:hypothetical protein